MKKGVFILTLFSSYFAQAQFGIVQDKDGFVNVRDEVNTSSKILAKINSNTILTYEDVEAKNWLMVEYKPENSGYISKDRIKDLIEFEKINPTKKSSTSIQYSFQDYRIAIETQKFNPKNHAITKDENTIIAIDNHDILGSDGVLPMTEFKTFKIYYKEKEINVPKEYYAFLYNADLMDLKLTYNKSLNQYYLFGTFSEGAGVFDALWVLENGKIVKHIAQINSYA